MTEYVASRLMRNFIGLLQSGARDLQNPDLAPYYAGPAVPSAEVESGLAAVQELNSAAGLGAMSAAEYTAQAGESSPAVFHTVVTGAGIELTFTDDLYEDDPSVRLPDSGYAASFSIDRGYDRAAVAAARARVGVVASGTQHLRVSSPPLVADADPYARIKIRRSKEFVRRYLSAV